MRGTTPGTEDTLASNNLMASVKEGLPEGAKPPVFAGTRAARNRVKDAGDALPAGSAIPLTPISDQSRTLKAQAVADSTARTAALTQLRTGVDAVEEVSKAEQAYRQQFVHTEITPEDEAIAKRFNTHGGEVATHRAEYHQAAVMQDLGLTPDSLPATSKVWSNLKAAESSLEGLKKHIEAERTFWAFNQANPLPTQGIIAQTLNAFAPQDRQRYLTAFKAVEDARLKGGNAMADAVKDSLIKEGAVSREMFNLDHPARIDPTTQSNYRGDWLGVVGGVAHTVAEAGNFVYNAEFAVGLKALDFLGYYSPEETEEQRRLWVANRQAMQDDIDKIPRSLGQEQTGYRYSQSAGDNFAERAYNLVTDDPLLFFQNGGAYIVSQLPYYIGAAKIIQTLGVGAAASNAVLAVAPAASTEAAAATTLAIAGFAGRTATTAALVGLQTGLMEVAPEAAAFDRANAAAMASGELGFGDAVAYGVKKSAADAVVNAAFSTITGWVPWPATRGITGTFSNGVLSAAQHVGAVGVRTLLEVTSQGLSGPAGAAAAAYVVGERISEEEAVLEALVDMVGAPVELANIAYAHGRYEFKLRDQIAFAARFANLTKKAQDTLREAGKSGDAEAFHQALLEAESNGTGKQTAIWFKAGELRDVLETELGLTADKAFADVALGQRILNAAADEVVSLKLSDITSPTFTTKPSTASALASIARQGAGALSFTEAQTLTAAGIDALKAEVKTLLADSDKGAGFAQSREALTKTLEAIITPNVLGVADEHYRKAAIELWVDLYTVAAQRRADGSTPEALFAEYPIQVARTTSEELLTGKARGYNFQITGYHANRLPFDSFAARPRGGGESAGRRVGGGLVYGAGAKIPVGMATDFGPVDPGPYLSTAPGVNYSYTVSIGMSNLPKRDNAFGLGNSVGSVAFLQRDPRGYMANVIEQLAVGLDNASFSGSVGAAERAAAGWAAMGVLRNSDGSLMGIDDVKSFALALRVTKAWSRAGFLAEGTSLNDVFDHLKNPDNYDASDRDVADKFKDYAYTYSDAENAALNVRALLYVKLSSGIFNNVINQLRQFTEAGLVSPYPELPSQEIHGKWLPVDDYLVTGFAMLDTLTSSASEFTEDDRSQIGDPLKQLDEWFGDTTTELESGEHLPPGITLQRLAASNFRVLRERAVEVLSDQGRFDHILHDAERNAAMDAFIQWIDNLDVREGLTFDFSKPAPVDTTQPVVYSYNVKFWTDVVAGELETRDLVTLDWGHTLGSQWRASNNLREGALSMLPSDMAERANQNNGVLTHEDKVTLSKAEPALAATAEVLLKAVAKSPRTADEQSLASLHGRDNRGPTGGDLYEDLLNLARAGKLAVTPAMARAGQTWEQFLPSTENSHKFWVSTLLYEITGRKLRGISYAAGQLSGTRRSETTYNYVVFNAADAEITQVLGVLATTAQELTGDPNMYQMVSPEQDAAAEADKLLAEGATPRTIREDTGMAQNPLTGQWQLVDPGAIPAVTEARFAQQYANDPAPKGKAYVGFSAAPGAADTAGQAVWGSFTSDQQREMTLAVVNQILPQVLAQFGATGHIVTQRGAWEGTPEVSLSLELTDPDIAAEVGKALAYVLGQDASFIMADAPGKGLEAGAGFTIALPDAEENTIDSVYADLWDNFQLIGHSTTGSRMMAMSELDVNDVNAALAPRNLTATGISAYSTLVQPTAADGTPTLDALKAEAERLKQAEIDKRSQLFQTVPSELSEKLAVADRMIAERGGLFAPNGQPSKLNRMQWAQVRTSAFKAWFGDWETDPANASKVVDENGEPMVVYHATNGDFNSFREDKRSDGFGYYFGLSEAKAKKAATGKRRVISAFIKADKIAGSLKAPAADWVQMRFDGVGRKLANEGFDAAYIKDEAKGALVVRNPNQIKSATDNSGAFSAATNNFFFQTVPETKTLFRKVQEAQRFGVGVTGVAPELAFDSRYNPGVDLSGAFATAAEHIGDLVHRAAMPQDEYEAGAGIGPGGASYGLSALREKTSRFLAYVQRGDDLDFLPQAERNAQWNFNPDNTFKKEAFSTPTEGVAQFKAAAQRYADAYKQVPVYTKLQQLSRDAAVALGEFRHNDLLAALTKINTIVRIDPRSKKASAAAALESYFALLPGVAESNSAPSELSEKLAVADRMVAEKGGLFAPNGKPSKLKRRQWAQVRTSAFKAWFGDWETDPANASKVVDENGEPLVVYHGTGGDFDAFDRSKGGEASGNNAGRKGHFFSGSTAIASDYAQRAKGDPNVMPAFLALPNPAKRKFRDIDQLDYWASVNDFSGGLMADTGDGQQVFMVKDSGQIKSATGNVGTFSGETDNILYQTVPSELSEKLAVADRMVAEKGGLFAPNGEKSKLKRHQWAQVRTSAFKAWFGDWETDPANASKVVDENGEPKVVYHGTVDLFTEFERRGGFRTGFMGAQYPVPSNAFFFTGNRTLAWAYARNRQDAGVSAYRKEAVTIPVFLRAVNPLDARKMTPKLKRTLTNAGFVFEKGDSAADLWRAADDTAVVSALQESGFDGFLFTERAAAKDMRVSGDVSSVAVFLPNQIKSAVGNSGAFSAATNNILFQTVPSVRPGARPHSVDVSGVHFSKQQHLVLEGGKALSGYSNKAEKNRLVGPDADTRIKTRLYAYVDEGKGVRPEDGVGSVRHDVTFRNLYDAKGDPLHLMPTDNNGIDRTNRFEAAILDAGFNGYYVRGAFGNQGAAILLGNAAKAVTPQSGAFYQPVVLTGTKPGEVAVRGLSLQRAADGSRMELATTDDGDAVLVNLYDADLDPLGLVSVAANTAAAEQAVQAAGYFGTYHRGKNTAVLFAADRNSIKPLMQEGDKKVRGAFNPRTLTISLTEYQNLSSFLHESAHAFFEICTREAARETATPQQKADMAFLMAKAGYTGTLQEWLLLPDALRVEAHETAAEMFEMYLLTGTPPTAEFAGLFKRLSGFMLATYTDAVELARQEGRAAKFDPEVAGVFNRMLAADAAIDAEAAAQQSDPFHTQQSDTIMADEEWRAYQLQLRQPDLNAAKAELTARSIKDMGWLTNKVNKYIRMLKGEAAELSKGLRAEVEATADEMRVFKARALFSRGTLPSPDFALAVELAGSSKLSAESLAREMGDAANAKWRYLPVGRYGVVSMTAGLDAGLIAGELGYDTVDQMVTELLETPARKEWVDAAVDREMLIRHGDINSPAALQKAANELVHDEAHLKLLATELFGFKRLYGSATEVLAAMKAKARSVVGSGAVSELTPDRTRVSARAKGKQALEAHRKGDREGAAELKRQQTLLAAVEREQRIALRMRDKLLSVVGRLNKSDKVLSRRFDLDAIYAARAIILSYGLQGKKVNPDPVRVQNYLDKVKAEGGITASLIEDIGSRLPPVGPYAALTVDQLRSVSEAVGDLIKIGRNERSIRIGSKMVSVDYLAEQIVDTLVARHKGEKGLAEDGLPHGPGTHGTLSKSERRWFQFNTVTAALRRVTHWATGLGEVFVQGIVRPVLEAANDARVWEADLIGKLAALFKANRALFSTTPVKSDVLKYTFQEGKLEILHALLHTGNESNFRKLLLGYAWGSVNADKTLNTTVWDAFLREMIQKNVLTKADMDFVQSVWDLTESVKPALQKAYHRMFGRYFAEVEVKPVQTPWGEYRGGYVPAVADRDLVPEAGRQPEAEDLMAPDNKGSFASVGLGMTESRTDVTRKLQLNLNVLSSHLAQASRIAFLEPAIRDVLLVLRHKDVADALQRHDPGVVNNLLMPWLQRTARQQVATQGKTKFGDKVFTALRGRVGINIMFLNILNTVQQITSLSFAALQVNKRFLLSGLAKGLTHPKDAAVFIKERSSFMAHRMDNGAQENSDLIRDIIANPNWAQRTNLWFARNGYFLQSAVQNIIDPVVWLGAYEQAMDAGLSEEDAVFAADTTVRETQNSYLPEDVASFEATTPFVRLFLQFAGYFNMWANLLGTGVQKIRTEGGSPIHVTGQALWLYFLGMFIPAVVGQLIVGGAPDDDDKDGKLLDDWLALFFGSQFRAGAAMIPGGGAVLGAVAGQFTDAPYDDRLGNPSVAAVETALRALRTPEAMQDGELSKAEAKALMVAFSLTTGVPTGQVAKTGLYLREAANQGTEVTPMGALKGR